MKRHQPNDIDDTEDRMGTVRELDFEKGPEGRIGDERSPGEVENEFPARRRREMGMSGGETQNDSQVEDNVSMDDLAPETLIDEQGTESPLDPSDETPADEELRIAGAGEIGGGIGLDEAQEGRVKPLDGKPWARTPRDEKE
ncbi:phosphotransferase system, HPr-related protein [Pseudomonas sp. ZM23]|uniref:Phosphotransferase system, HPr-related protein n=1 Tax=Pseudomonas triclosanedens TaxID=2961893 RepID=A0ABY7A610_9PSED|nr:phosphotransferase system, HPr-related protein [Pseudomonas triclosanedens]MCP8466240.1 phosphotransferase system, HPr-related protein [Pseudomonas triclosanedens]MCP8471766.1 phosphotransferase system, HPr-related protein [Pseudomonas triclosanedens]MCP8478881.1 phosphotransferase system, HPr-related protein [Pseudomonas triclosanedens]WAI52342.1 phosphotransferase system, HPr-related protein [Pseudomonas triclosanedens]